MRFFWMLLLVIGVSDAFEDNSIVRHTRDIDVTTLLNAMAAPPCMRDCTTNLTIAASDAISMIPSKALDHMCKALDNTQKCIKERIGCFPRDIFETATSGLTMACGNRRHVFNVMSECLDSKAATVVRDCESKCGLRDVVVDLSHGAGVVRAAKMGGNIFIVAQHTGPVCKSLQCFLPCLNRELNAACPLSGYYTIDTLLTPLDAAAALMEKLSPPVRNMINVKLPKDCLPLIDKASLLEIRKATFVPRK